MFTGIIEELGRVRSIEQRGEGVRMTVEARTVTEGRARATPSRSTACV
jgi:riboflavin synthase alpha subunit